jgi:hypothetical protein
MSLNVSTLPHPPERNIFSNYLVPSVNLLQINLNYSYHEQSCLYQLAAQIFPFYSYAYASSSFLS